jgi:hypothetical protein
MLTGDLLVAALSAVSKYDIYEMPVLVRATSSATQGTTVLLLPLRYRQWFEETFWGDGESKPAWSIEVVFPLASKAEARVTVSGDLTVIDVDSPKVWLGRALLAACKQLSRGKWNVAEIAVRVSKTQDGYWVSLRRRAEVRGGNTMVKISEDLKQVFLVPGR